jgi:two-component system, NarL family, response regulator NreC
VRLSRRIVRAPRSGGADCGAGGYRPDMTGSTRPDGRPLTVALADDHPVVRAGLRTLLQADDSVRVVAEFEDLPGTVSGVPAVKPNALVLDLVMAGESSLDAIPGLLAGTPGLRIVVLTMQEDPGFAREALRLGASGYVLKDAAADELLLALRTIMRGATYLHPTLGAQMAVLEASTSPLTDREIQVLRLLAEGHTNAEISRRLYLSLRTVEAHRGQLRTKLGLDTRAELSTYAREHGLVH